MTENIKTKDSEKEELQKIEDEIKNHKDKISPVCDEILQRLLCIAKGESADIMVDELVKERQNAIQEYHRISESSKKGDDGESVSESSKKGDDEENVSVSKRVQAFLLIKRYINIINFFLEKYEKKIPKELLDYYLFDNRLKEINNIGLAFYMDVHFEYKREEERTYIYRCDGSTTTGIEEELFEKVLTKEELLKKIVELSQVHISKRISYDNSQKDWFQSYSACIGRNLHRYFDAPGFDSEARYEIANGSFVNTIKYTDNRDRKNSENVDKEDKVEYIQEVLWNGGIEEQIEEQEGTARFKNIGFCLAMYNVRDNANKNFSEWSKAYLKGSIDWNALSSDRESNDGNLSVESRNKRLLGAIPDYEIVTTKDYYTEVKQEELDSRKRHKKVFDKVDAAERIGLLFHYYKEYLFRAKKTSERHENIEEEMRNKVNGILDCFFNNKQNCEKVSITWDQFESFREKTKYLINDGTNSESIEKTEYLINDDTNSKSIEKIRNILTYVNWEKEIKYMENIYVTMLNEDKKNPHVNPNTMYGLDSKDTHGRYIVNNIYRLIVSRIKLELLNIAVFDGKKTIAICETATKPSNGRYIFTDFN